MHEFAKARRLARAVQRPWLQPFNTVDALEKLLLRIGWITRVIGWVANDKDLMTDR